LVIFLLAAVFCGLGAVGLTLVLREAPPIARWNEAGVKPWACDLCMSFWCSAICLVVAAAAGEINPPQAFFSWMPAFVIAFAIVQRVRPVPMGGPPIDPPSGSDP
jgi:hypothetical protein